MTAPSLPVSSVVNVTVEMAPTASALRNFGACLILGDSDAIDISERIREYSGLSEVASDFGAASREYLAAQAFFSQSPKPVAVLVGRWASSAVAGRLRGRVLTVSEQDIDSFTTITSGAVALKVDGVEKKAVALDFSGCSNLNAVASAITSSLGGAATATWTGTRFQIVSATTGKASSVTLSSAPVGGSYTDIASLLGLSGGVAVGGAEAESIAECLAELCDYQNWYALCPVASSLSDEAKVSAAGAIEAASPSRIIALTTQDAHEIDPAASGTLGEKLKALGYNRTLLVYSSGSPVAAASILGRMASINFEGSNTTITLKFKQCPGVEPERLRISQANALKTRRVNVFAAYQNDTSILQEGVMSGGWYIDETHGLDWLQNRVETDLWNLLYTHKKVGQDEAGADLIVATVSKSLEQGVANGLIAPGVWNGAGFGALETGDTLSSGYYVYIQPLSEQSQSDREARKAPPVQIAVKLKGAVHSIDVGIVVNR